MSQLIEQHCQHYPSILDPDSDEFAALWEQIPEWTLDADAPCIQREFKFKDFYQTVAFINALAWIANQEDHHPDLEASYNTCRVRYSTHSVQGLSLNDLICAAKIDQLV